MDPKHYSKYDRDTTKWKSKNRGQLTPLSNSAHLLPAQSHSNSNSNKLIIDKSCSLLQNRQKTNISIHKNVKKPHQGKGPNGLITNKKILIRNQISEDKSGKNRVFRICISNRINKIIVCQLIEIWKSLYINSFGINRNELIGNLESLQTIYTLPQ